MVAVAGRFAIASHIMSSSSICLRCLSRSFRPLDPSNVTQRSAFSTTASLAASPMLKKGNTTKPTKGVKKTLTIKKKKPAAVARPPAVGERKALRKRIVLSNTNALEVEGMQNISAATVDGIEAFQGRMIGLDDAAVDMLRALETFKPTQGWNLFRRPATLVRQETVDLAQAMSKAQEAKSGVGKVICGERGSGKSVLALQGLAMAQAKGWIVVHLPEGRDLTSATNSYEPVETPDGTHWIQPHYTAHLLSNVLNANKDVLSKLQISKQHNLPIPIQPNISLDRFVAYGATDPQIAYPIWQALWSELTSVSTSQSEGQQRPPVFVSLDGLDHVMRASAYLDAEMQLIHAHDLTLVRDFNNLLTGTTSLPNGGMVVGVTSGSNRPSAPTLEHYVLQNTVHPIVSWAQSLSDQVSSSDSFDLSALDLSAMANMHVSHPAYGIYSDFLYEVHSLEQEMRTSMQEDTTVTFTGSLKTRLDSACATLTSSAQKLAPKWDPYVEIDDNVQAVMKDVDVQRLFGLSKPEARGVIEYYAQSGMMRSTVTESLVNEKWSLAGKGLVGELESNSVKLRF